MMLEDLRRIESSSSGRGLFVVDTRLIKERRSVQIFTLSLDAVSVLCYILRCVALWKEVSSVASPDHS